MKRSIFSICMLFITAVIVSSDQSKELNGIVGQSVEFTAAVKNKGSLRYNGVPIGDVTNGGFTAQSEFTGRLQWDRSSGLFSLSELKDKDSGKYEVQNTGPVITTVFQLSVYMNVSKPHVSVTSNEYPCTILCTVERGTGVTLSWYREGEERPYSSSDSLDAPYLKLPQAVDKGGIYTCEAKNFVSHETDSITVEPHCTGSSTGMIVGIVIGFLVFAIIGFVAGFCYSKKCPNATSAGQPNGKGPEVQPDASKYRAGPPECSQWKRNQMNHQTETQFSVQGL
ncbi:hypothetical protein SKAU_G00345050 [Synaphobranchus kaupii]|uniref:Ig-like domain-containing protein n=1 Tax=Synaphobranchus kaupii TaxID=118154 RepID=A0A9Q1IHE5_SYNKA|nr:hypothetical protein SKAU_G00345050 [Synaphobranchus kaupii]